MLTPFATGTTALERLSARTTLPVSAKVAVHVADLLARWSETRRTRYELKYLPDSILDDIGLTREQADREAEKPFWRP